MDNNNFKNFIVTKVAPVIANDQALNIFWAFIAINYLEGQPLLEVKKQEIYYCLLIGYFITAELK